MDAKGFPSTVYLQWQKIKKHRKPILLLCTLVLWTSGAGLVFLNAFLSNNGAIAAFSGHHIEQNIVTKATPTPTPSPSPTPTPRPTPIPTAAPITPFPTTMNAQILTMESNNRFFYDGNRALPEIALTFDDGPNPPYTGEILNILQRYGIKASFFCVGSNAQNYPDQVKNEYQAGNIVGNHTWSHPYLPYLSQASITWQFSTTSNMLQHITGTYANFFRPPYGALSTSTLQYANEHGLSVVVWNDDPQDWARPGVKKIVATALSEATNGGIILMHDGGGDRSETVAALPIIIESLRARGYSFVTIKQLAEHQQPTAVQTPVPQGTPPPSLEPTMVIASSASIALPIWKRDE
jgi:peptidoglycan/xylan/chitin deacetylase (PgdA/CDA1 family)